uniref:RNA-directed RNA polymerase n=1 Tax=Shenzhen Rhabdo-like virus 2 TaxID=2789376 RepID=A0A7T1LYR0_9RHAB|nr:RNA-dependent RNA polymerase [Shenzhen Rhabdo-like virus 2]
MTYTENDLKKMIIAKTKKQGLEEMSRNSIYVNVNIDFKKWNSNMRHNLVRHVFRRMDNLFGYDNLITRTHRFFKRCTYYLAEDGTDLKFQNGVLAENDCCYIGSEGGNEGLRQKPWTVVTVCGIHKVCVEMGLQYFLSGQGDNQVVTLIFPSDRAETREQEEERIKTKSREFVDNLDAFFSSVGLPIKKAETWLSSRLFAYGKKLFRSGVPLSMALKKISRAFPLSNDSIPSLEEDISRIWGSVMAAAEFDHHYVASYVMGCILTGLSLRNHIIYSPVTDGPLVDQVYLHPKFWPERSHSRVQLPGRPSFQMLLKSILWRPRVFGGYPVINPFDMTIKGFPDPVASSIAFLKRMYILATGDKDKDLILKILNPPFSHQIKPAMIMKDCTSINVIGTPTPADTLLDLSEKFVANYNIKNKELKEVVGEYKDEMTHVAEKLFACDPYFAPFMTDVYESTSVGYRERTIKKCSTTTTIRHKAAEAGTDEMSDMMKVNEIRKLRLHIWSVFSSRRSISKAVTEKCSKKTAQKWRNDGWGKTILGVSVSHPSEVLYDLEPSHQCTNRNSGDFIQVFLTPWANDVVGRYEVPGKTYPYIGSETREKTVKTMKGTIYVIEPLLKPSLRLMRAVNWFVRPDSFAGSMLKRLVSSMSDINPMDYASAEDVKGGSAIHRYTNAMTSKMCRHNGNYQLLTHMSVTTENLKDLSRGSTNTDAHFQSMMLFAQMRVLDALLDQEVEDSHAKVPLEYHFHRRCTDCIEEIPEVDITGDANWDQVTFPTYPNNRYLYRPESSLKIRDEIKVEPKTQVIRVHDLDPLYLREMSSFVLGWTSMTSTESEFDPNDLISWTWLARIDPRSLFDGMASKCCAMAWHGWIMRGNRTILTPSALNESALEIMIGIGTRPFSRLANVFIDGDTKSRFLDPELRVLSPAETVPNSRVSAKAIHDAACLWITRYISRSRWLTSPRLPYIRGQTTSEDVVLYTFSKRHYMSDVPETTVDQYRDWWRGGERDPTSLGLRVTEMRSDLDTMFKKSARFDPAAGRPKTALPIRNILKTTVSEVKPSTRCTGSFPRSYGKLATREPRIITGAVYRALDLAVRFSLFPGKGRSAMVVGDGTGGISALLANNGYRVFYQTLVEYHRVTQQGLSVRAPSAFDRLTTDVTDSVINPGQLATVCTDLTDLSYPDYFAQYPKEDYSLLWSDAEGSFWDSDKKLLAYKSNLLSLARDFLSAEGRVICKWYFNNAKSSSIGCSLRDSLNRGSVYTSRFSTAGSGEAYISGFRSMALALLSSEIDISKAVLESTSKFPPEDIIDSYSSYIRSLIAPTKTSPFEDIEVFGSDLAPMLLSAFARESGEWREVRAIFSTLNMMIRRYNTSTRVRIFHQMAIGDKSSLGHRVLHRMASLLIVGLSVMHNMGNTRKRVMDAEHYLESFWAIVEKSGHGVNLYFSERPKTIRDKVICLQLFKGKNLLHSKSLFSMLGALRGCGDDDQSRRGVIEIHAAKRFRGTYCFVVSGGAIGFRSVRGSKGPRHRIDVKGQVFPYVGYIIEKDEVPMSKFDYSQEDEPEMSYEE